MCSSSRFCTQNSASCLAQKTPLVKRGRKPRKKKPTSKRIAQGLYLQTTLKGKKRWVLRFYHQNKQLKKVIGDAEVMSQIDAIASP